MRKMIAVSLLALCAGCSSPGTIHHSPIMGNAVGDIIAIEDEAHGTLIYKYVGGTGNGSIKVLVKKGSEWQVPEE